MKTGAASAIPRDEISGDRLDGLFKEFVDTRMLKRQSRTVAAFSRIAGQEPAFMSTDSVDGCVTAFALRLRGTASELDGQARTALERRQVEWARRLVSTLYVVAPRWFELRYVVTPAANPDAHPILSVLLVGFGKGTTASGAMAVARELWMEMESTVRVDESVYPFGPIRSSETLRALLSPFVPQHIVEVSASSGRLLPPDRSLRTIGFQADSPIRDSAADIVLPLAPDSEERGVSTVCAALSSCGCPIQMVVRFEASRFSSAELGLLDLKDRSGASEAGEWRFSPAQAGPLDGKR